MSEEPHPRAPGPEPSGGPWKWLIGAAVAAIVLGGGYYAWKSMSPAEPPSQIAEEDSALPGEPFEAAAPDETPDLTDAPPADELAPAAAPQRRRQTAQAEPAPEQVPEQVIGVGPIDLTSSALEEDQTADENEIIVRGPRWVRSPSARRLSAAYPQRALERGREGEALIHCVVLEEGALDCVRASETPANAGFGTAALRVSRMYRHAPVRANGSSAIGTPVNLRVIFRIAEDDRRRG